jgi:tetratricopeptide (TPR) repeat protein
MLMMGNPAFESLRAAIPTYEIIANDTVENREARLLLNLFAKKDRALFLKGADEFVAKYPQSAYDEIVRYMMADTYFTFWRTRNSSPDFERAMTLYQLLTEKYPKSPVTPRTLLLIGYSYDDRGDSFGSLKALQRFGRTNPTSRYLDHVNVLTADAYLRLNRYDDSYKLLDDIEKNAKAEKSKFDAAFRKGDVFFRKRDWEESIHQYKLAVEKYPEQAKHYPNAFYNTAEAEFESGKYREALEAYRQFLQRFPEHEHGGYAMTRMGELLGILGADPKRSQGAFFESFFRYRATPGAGVARIRSLASRMPEMKDKELGSAMREIASISDKYSSHPVDEAKKKKEEDKKKVEASKQPDGKAEEGKEAKVGEGAEHGDEEKEVAGKEDEDKTKRRPELPGIEEFSTLLITDGYTARKEFDIALKDLVTYYQQNPQSANKDRLLSRIVGNIALGIHAAVDKRDFIEALRRYSKNTDGWLKNADRVDTRFDVAHAYEQAGVFKEAITIYKEVAKRISEKTAPNKPGQQMYENLPTLDAVRLRLAACAVKDGNLVGAEADLKTLPEKAELTEHEQIERAEVSADVAEGRGQPEVARKYLTQLMKSWKGDAQLTGSLHLRIAKMSMTAKDYKDAETHLNQVLAMGKENEKADENVQAKALEMKGDVLLARGKRPEAIKTYQSLLAAYETKRPLASVRYKVGQLLFEDGDLKNAENTWNELSDDRDKMWARLAKEQMQGAKWQSEYKKYLTRIPAAADMQKSAASDGK